MKHCSRYSLSVHNCCVSDKHISKLGVGTWVRIWFLENDKNCSLVDRWLISVTSIIRSSWLALLDEFQTRTNLLRSMKFDSCGLEAQRYLIIKTRKIKDKTPRFWSTVNFSGIINQLTRIPPHNGNPLASNLIMTVWSSFLLVKTPIAMLIRPQTRCTIAIWRAALEA